MNKVNYQKELDKILKTLDGNAPKPKLLLHSCCAPCSSYCLIYLCRYFDITSYYYNPNISDVVEYFKRLSELEKLAQILNEEGNSIRVLDGGFDSESFFKMAKGLENLPEGGERCDKCFHLRLERSAEIARQGSFDYFTSTLTISPLKDEQVINNIGLSLSDKYGVKWLPSDFKKKGGYAESVKLSEKYGLYRQDYCGCVYSLRRDYDLKRKKGIID